MINSDYNPTDLVSFNCILGHVKGGEGGKGRHNQKLYTDLREDALKKADA